MHALPVDLQTVGDGIAAKKMRRGKRRKFIDVRGERAERALVQELLGHASLSTTQAYTAVDTARLMEVYDRTHPKA